MQNDQITITINGKTHQFKTDDITAMRNLPWAERKLLIELLENIKQAEYVKAVKQPNSTADAQFNPATGVNQQRHSAVLSSKAKPLQGNPTSAQLDPQVKASEKGVDDLMQRLILEQQSNHKPVPDKSSVVKLLLLAFAVLIALALIF